MLETRTKLFVIAAIGVAIVAGLAVLGFVTRQPTEEKPHDVTQEEQQQEQEAEPTDSDDGHVHENLENLLIQNIEPLFAVFSDAQTLHINAVVTNYAFEQRQEEKIFIVDDYVSKLDDDRYGFTIRNEAGEHLFYVIATKMPDDVVKVEIFP